MLPAFIFNNYADTALSIFYPRKEPVYFMGCGGWWDEHPNPRGYVDTQIRRLTKSGVLPDAAAAFAKAMQFGGKTTNEALEIIKNRACGHVGYNIEIVSKEDLPHDRWFRNAWTRNHNGAVSIDLEKARPIQWERLRITLQRENTRREQLLFELPKVDVPIYSIKTYIKNASSVDELRRIWPEELNVR